MKRIRTGKPMKKAPIAIIIFNRPDHAKALRESLQQEEERELFVISDGARKGRAEEVERVAECRRIFADWPGKVHLNYAPENIGCKSRVSSGLNWVFERTERAIILEDDCLPHPDFFRFCDELLEAYSDNERVMSICGTKTFPCRSNKNEFIFTKYASSWGWATWRRAWSQYDDQYNRYSSTNLIKELKFALGSYRAAIYWFYLIHKVRSGQISSWAYCWNISCFLLSGLHAYANENLILNSGFGPNATHTAKMMPYIPRNYGRPLSFPISFPINIHSSPESDKWIENNIYSKSMTARLRWLWRKLQ